jgi:hypothetical protein
VSFRRLVPTITLLAVFTMALRASVTSDTWWHLRAGAWMLEHGQILRADPFSLTRLGESWIYPGWLAEILMTLLFRQLGFGGLNLMTAVCVLIAFLFLWHVSEGQPLVKAFAMVLGAAVAGVYWSARPQILSFAMAGAFAWALHRVRRDRRAIWLLPVFMALWTNLHGGFFIGLLLLGIEAAGALLDRFGPRRLEIPADDPPGLTGPTLAAGVALSLLAISFNPHGPVMLLYPWKTVSIGVLRDYIQEWQSPDFHSLEVQPFLWMLFLTLAFMAVSPQRPRWREILTVVLFGYMGFLAARNVALFGLLALPVLTRHASATLQPWLPHTYPGGQFSGRTMRVLNWVLLSLAALAAILKGAIPMALAPNEAAVRSQAPVAAVDFLEARQPPGPLLNSYNWGSYLIWRLYPGYLSFVDGRTDLFDDEILEQYLSLWRADAGWERLVQRWDLRLALLEPEAPLSAALERAGWETLYQDEQAVVLAAPE